MLLKGVKGKKYVKRWLSSGLQRRVDRYKLTNVSEVCTACIASPPLGPQIVLEKYTHTHTQIYIEKVTVNKLEITVVIVKFV
jgi:hypothetical protein